MNDNSRDGRRRERGRRRGGEEKTHLLPVMIIDLVLAIARGAAELPALATLVGVRLADPLAERPRELGAVGPQVGVVAGVRAELVPRTVVLAHAARLTGHVRQAQAAPVVATAKHKSTHTADH